MSEADKYYVGVDISVLMRNAREQYYRDLLATFVLDPILSGCELAGFNAQQIEAIRENPVKVVDEGIMGQAVGVLICPPSTELSARLRMQIARTNFYQDEQ